MGGKWKESGKREERRERLTPTPEPSIYRCVLRLNVVCKFMLLHEYPVLTIYHEVYISSHAFLLRSEELAAGQNSHKQFRSEL